jgi:hypothetical protein
VADWLTVRPSLSWAVTAKNGPTAFTVIIVSKPERRCEPTGASALPAGPASTVQTSTAVAPFQPALALGG